MGEQEMSDGGRATVKQVYDAVDNTRVELSGKIDKLADKLDNVVIAHEHRLTDAEGRISSAEREMGEHQERIKSLEDYRSSHEADHAVTRGHNKALVAVGGVLVTLLSGGVGTLLAHTVH